MVGLVLCRAISIGLGMARVFLTPEYQSYYFSPNFPLKQKHFKVQINHAAHRVKNGRERNSYISLTILPT